MAEPRAGRRTGSWRWGRARGLRSAVPYQRSPTRTTRASGFIFEGVEGELIGDHPNLQTRWGAAGYEIDRFEHELGTPPAALLLGSSVGFSDPTTR